MKHYNICAQHFGLQIRYEQAHYTSFCIDTQEVQSLQVFAMSAFRTITTVPLGTLTNPTYHNKHI